MNEHQRKLIENMLKMINEYIDSNNNFCKLVDSLESAIDASEIIDNDILNNWYDLWTPLEIRRSLYCTGFDAIRALEEVNDMKLYLVSLLLK